MPDIGLNQILIQICHRQTLPAPCIQGDADNLTETFEKVRLHARVKAIRIVAANGQHAGSRFFTQRDQRDRPDLYGVFREQEIQLCIPGLATTGCGLLQKRPEWL